LKKWQSEEEINARLRELTRDVRALRNELRSLSGAVQQHSPGANGTAKPQTTQPLEEDRKLRLTSRRKRS
jgi:hypothetical protein